ncbi:hypothetical protein GQ457_15G024950 [Hibiscus cannabinus]
MAASKLHVVGLFSFMLSCSLLASASASYLKVGFYAEICPSAETIVRKAVNEAVSRNPGLAAGLIRMHFHDCFVRGCDASILLRSLPGNPPAERDHPANNPSLRGFEVIDEAKARIEALCPGTVSCADIIAFAARDSAYTAGGIYYAVPSGRRDGCISLSDEVLQNLPTPFFNATQLAQSFARKGMSVDEMVTLSGAHSIGVAHCPAFSNRLYSFNATHPQDPSLDPNYAAFLKTRCPPPPPGTVGDVTTTVLLDVVTPNRLDNKYYSELRHRRGLLTSDQTLIDSSSTSRMVLRNKRNGAVWGRKFARAMVHMSSLDVLTGHQASAASLKVGFYAEICPSAETIVRKAVDEAVSRNPGMAAGLIRMHFHDCFVRGCDASILLRSLPGNPPVERDHPANNPSLRGFEVIDEAKARIEALCPGTVSCADIIAFAARDSAYTAGGIYYAVPSGRRDGHVSLSDEVLQNLPTPFFNATQIAQSFARKGMSVDEMVTLSGAHSIGVAHCPAFSNRLYSFNATHPQDPSLDPNYAAFLKKVPTSTTWDHRRCNHDSATRRCHNKSAGQQLLQRAEVPSRFTHLRPDVDGQ